MKLFPSRQPLSPRPLSLTRYVIWLGALCLLAGCLARFGLRSFTLPGTLVASTALLAWARRQDARALAVTREGDSELWRQQRAVFQLILAVQWTGIAFLATLLVLLGRIEWLAGGALVIVAGHFLLLARLYEAPVYYVAGASLAAWCAVYPFLDHLHVSSALGLLGAGALLWVTAIAIMLMAPQTT